MIVALVTGEFTVKRFITSDDTRLLLPENSRNDPLPITDEMDFRVMGRSHILYS